jgi:hypothetical protein
MNYLKSRRDFLKKTSAAAMATMGMGAPLASILSSCGTQSIPTTADSVILLFMAGGWRIQRLLILRDTHLSEREWRPVKS